jgi:hypothetical protein
MPVVVAAPLKVSRKQRVELEAMARSSSLPHRVVVQSSALLLAADGVANGNRPGVRDDAGHGAAVAGQV